MVESVVGVERTREARAGNPRFFAYISTIMLLLVFVAFFRSFYFREFSTVVDRLGQRELPLYLVAHGWILTAWYSLFCIQAWLGAKRKVRTHRKLGIAGLAVAAAVVLSGALTTIRVVPRDFAAGRAVEGTAGIVIGNFLALAVFVSFVAIAVYLRRRPEIHKRLMLFASMIIIGPAFAGSGSGNRLVGGFFAKISPPVVADFLYIYALALGIVAVVGFDLYSRRRVHKATAWGGAVSFLSILVALVMQSSTFGIQLVESLR